MKPKKNIFSFPIILLISLLHQSCIDELDMQINSSNTYIIDAMLDSSDSIHFVKISLVNETPIDSLTKFSVKLTDDKGNIQIFEDSEDILANYPPLTDYYNYYNYKYELEKIWGKFHLYDGNSYWKEPVDIIIKNCEENLSKIFFANYKLEIGRKYTLSVTIDDKEYIASEKLLPQVEITSMRYEKTKKFKSIGEGYHTMKIPVFCLVNTCEDSKYFIASLGELNSLYSGSLRIFSTENMKDTIRDLKLNEYNYEPTYEGGVSVGFNNDDDWYIDEDSGSSGMPHCYCFYPISKANYEYYKVIEKQIKTDGGLYSPNAATPVTNFTGGKVYGQFIVTSESYIYDRGGYNF